MYKRQPSQHDFDHVYTRQLYAGFGHKQFGELTYGNMVTITDEAVSYTHLMATKLNSVKSVNLKAH